MKTSTLVDGAVTVKNRPDSPPRRSKRGCWLSAADRPSGCSDGAEAESSPDSPGHSVDLRHRAGVRELFAELLRPAGVTSSDDLLILQLAALYDGTMTSAHAEPGPPWAYAAREAARTLINPLNADNWKGGVGRRVQVRNARDPQLPSLAYSR